MTAQEAEGQQVDPRVADNWRTLARVTGTRRGTEKTKTKNPKGK